MADNMGVLNKHIHVRASIEDKQQLQQLARVFGIDESAVIRRLIASAHADNKEAIEAYAALDRKFGNTTNGAG